MAISQGWFTPLLFKDLSNNGILSFWGNINQVLKVWDVRISRLVFVVTWLLLVLLKVVFSYQEL